MILCIDHERGCSEANLPKDAKLIRYKRQIDIGAALGAISSPNSHSGSTA